MCFFCLQLKSVLEIAVELNRIHELGLKNQLTPNDMTGGTFSLSNIGAVSNSPLHSTNIQLKHFTGLLHCPVL